MSSRELLFKYLNLLVVISSLKSYVYGCTPGTFSIESTSSSNHLGILKYCYDGNSSNPGEEPIPVCGKSWNEMLSELVCRAILNVSDISDTITVNHELREGISNDTHVQLNCGQTLSSCNSTIEPCDTEIIVITCQAVCNPSCVNGDCVSPDKCSCYEGWTGSTCSEAFCTSPCMNGSCDLPEICTCNPGWNGISCTEAICNPQCGNGICVEPNLCNCSEGWNGTTCSEAVCNSPCIHGDCVSPHICRCSEGWTGSTCSEAVCHNCSKRGECTNPNECTCEMGWTGHNCMQAQCIPPCGNGGDCVSPGVCSCPVNWTGDRCTEAACYDGFCINGGNCSHPNGTCTCPEDWEGSQCQEATCNKNFCKNFGTCLHPNVNCTCLFMFRGDFCEEVNYFITTLILAAILLLVIAAVILHCVRKSCQKCRKKDSRKFDAGNVPEITSPTVNPFMNATMQCQCECVKQAPDDLKGLGRKSNTSVKNQSSERYERNTAVSKEKRRPSFLLQVSNISYNVFRRGGTKRKGHNAYEEVTLDKTKNEPMATSTHTVCDYEEIDI